MNKETKFLILDVETCNFVEDAFVYDIGYIIADSSRIYERRSFVVYETFCGMKDLMNTCYYAAKLPMYEEDIDLKRRKLRRFFTIRSIMLEDMREHNVHDVIAYNCYFDRTALDRTLRFLTCSKYRYFFPYGTKFHCIWNMACQVLFTQKTYARIAANEHWYSDKGNYKTSAEHAYRYITGNWQFDESHTGLEDVLIEYEIWKKCKRQHKKMDTNINRLCWRIPTIKHGRIKIE